MHPTVARRSCEDCRTYQYQDSGPHFAASPYTRGGEVQKRPAGTKTPCRFCPKIPEGRPPSPSSAVELTEAQKAAWDFYKECRAVNQFPTDPWSRWLSAVFRSAEDSAERENLAKVQTIALGSLLGGVVRA